MPSLQDKKFYFILGARDAAIASAATFLVDLLFAIFAFATIMSLLKFYSNSDEKGVFVGKSILNEIYDIMIPAICYLIFNVGFTIMLIVGIVEARSKMMLPWLIATASGILVFFLLMFLAYMLPDTEAETFGFLAVLIVIMGVMYKWEVVKYCYYQIKNEEEIAARARGPLPNQINEAVL